MNLLQRFEARGKNLSYGEAGSGKTMLFFIHGFPDDPSGWHKQLEFFAPHYHVVCPALPGVCGSEASSLRNFSLDSVVLDHLKLIHHFAPQKVIVIGHDLGGPYAYHLASLLGENCAALVLLNAPSLSMMWRRKSNFRQMLRSWYVPIFQVPALAETIFRILPKGLESKLLADRSEGGSLADATELLKAYRALAIDAQAIRATERPLAAPALILWGAQDPYLLVPTEDEAARISTRSELRVLNAGHWMQLSHAEEVDRILEKFFAAACGVGT